MPRFDLPGIAWPISHRRNDWFQRYYAKKDYRFYPGRLRELAETFGCTVHAYVHMTDHVTSNRGPYPFLKPARAGKGEALPLNA
jgi:hypothetical protein